MNNNEDMKLSKLFAPAALVMLLLAVASCSDKKFSVSGTITDAKDSLLYFENMGLNGPETVDSVKLGEDGSFSFSDEAPGNPEFYRLRIGRQIVNIGIDSTEEVSITASYPTMSQQYEVKGSYECTKMKELALMQLGLQAQVDALAQNPNISYDREADSVAVLLAAYKYKVERQYIFREPMKAYAYYALFQTVMVGGRPQLIFDPRSNKDDVKVFAAVATSWDTYYPGSLRGKNLHNIAIEGMKNVRIVQAQQNQTIDASKISTAGVIEIALPDNKGVVRRLTDLKGKVVLLDFNVFKADGSVKHNMWLRSLYNKYHKAGLEIYQVSVDSDEHFWKTSTEALPWVSVRDENGLESNALSQYNVQQIPTFFLIDKNNVLQKRDTQIKDIDAEIKSLL
ncbi:MAG: thioredoxin-like domain-containing protein [Prevotella sp.]|jgi:peroxiredoxin